MKEKRIRKRNSKYGDDDNINQHKKASNTSISSTGGATKPSEQPSQTVNDQDSVTRHENARQTSISSTGGATKPSEQPSQTVADPAIDDSAKLILPPLSTPSADDTAVDQMDSTFTSKHTITVPFKHVFMGQEGGALFRDVSHDKVAFLINEYGGDTSVKALDQQLASSFIIITSKDTPTDPLSNPPRHFLVFEGKPVDVKILMCRAEDYIILKAASATFDSIVDGTAQPLHTRFRCLPSDLLISIE
ncbi:unnamed protein product, partial [Caenorhabditis auriculariae]